MSANALITDARGYAGTILTTATGAIDDAKAAISNMGYTIIGAPNVGMPDAPDVNLDLTLPALSDITVTMPTAPGTGPVYQDIADIDTTGVPTLTAAVPEVTLPNKPSQVAAFSDTAPAIVTDFVFPEPPAELSNPLPLSPTIADHAVPVAPQITLPSFNGVMPTNDTVAPTDLDITFGNAYSNAAPQMITMVNGYVDAQLAKVNPQYHTQMAAIEAQLTKYLAGGTGLNAAAENAIYERARSKNNAEALRVRDAAYDEAASRGFTMPTGALMSALQLARQSGADNNAAAAREIVVMQAEMEQKNLQFAVTTSANLRTTLLNSTMMYMQNLTSLNSQALDYAKQILGALIETYNTAVKAFSVKLDAYRAEAQVYEVRMKGAMAAVELYAAEIKALEALVNVDNARVAVYRARIDALTAYAGLYKAEIEAVLGRASLEKMKMEVFQIKVQAYTAQVQAKNAEWGGYSASIDGEVAKVKMYGAQVEAYNAKVHGYQALIGAKTEAVRAKALTNQARATQYQAQVAGYSAVVQANATVAQTRLENQRQEVVAFQARTAAAVAQFQVRSEYYKATAQIGIENAKLGIHSISLAVDNKRRYAESLANLSSQLASIHGNLAGAAMSGMNSLAAETSTA